MARAVKKEKPSGAKELREDIRQKHFRRVYLLYGEEEYLVRQYRQELIKAVCGAGKTEIVVPVIAAMLRKKKKVCFAIARRQVVLELAARLQKIFPRAAVVPVCQGYTQRLSGDLIICTTHGV